VWVFSQWCFHKNGVCIILQKPFNRPVDHTIARAASAPAALISLKQLLVEPANMYLKKLNNRKIDFSTVCLNHFTAFVECKFELLDFNKDDEEHCRIFEHVFTVCIFFANLSFSFVGFI